MRCDKYLFERGHAKSRSAAETLIREGCVLLDGQAVRKPSFDVDETREHAVEITGGCPYVSRGGFKLAGALSTFQIDVTGMTALDVGASTGGFTDCLLQNGAKKVFAVDSGVGQMDASLLADPRVKSIEKYNARDMKRTDFDEGIDVAVMDVSFISQTLILPRLAEVLDGGALLVSLIKPQFEAGRAAIGKNGLVKSKKERFAAVLRVLECASAMGFGCFGFALSPIEGGDGNREYIAAFRRGGASLVDAAYVKRIIDGENERR